MLVGLIASQPDRVSIWASQLAANDFPPVCAMTGRPAEIWRKFSFSTPPPWVYALLILVCLGGIGIIAFAIVNAVVSQRASGYLPLTRSSKRTVDLVIWVPVGLIVGWIVLWVAAIAAASATPTGSESAVPGILFGLGALAFIGGVVGRLVITKLVIPSAKVMEPEPGQTDKIVELRNVNANFVEAVRQLQHSRLAQPPSSN